MKMQFILAILHMYLMPFGDPSHIHTYILSKPEHMKSELGSYQMYIYCVLYCLLKPFTVKQVDWGAVWHISTNIERVYCNFTLVSASMYTHTINIIYISLDPIQKNACVR